MKKYWLHILILVFFFAESIGPPTDFDLGWHLRYGQYFFQTGHVLKDNIISYFWPAYHWVQASWGYDLLLYQTYIHSGFAGIALSGAIMTMIIFLLVTRPIWRMNPLATLFLGSVFFSQGVALYAAGMRSQTPSTIFFALMLLVLDNPAYYATLPFIFLLWANMHGGFSLGLIIAGILWFGKPKKPFLALMLGASLVTALINPWGFRIYEETFKHTTNTNLAFITEWKPLTQGVVESVVAAAVCITVLIVALIKKSRRDIPYLIAFILVTYLSFQAIRFLILFAVMATYYLARTLPTIEWAVMKNTWVKILAAAILVLLIAVDITHSNKYFQIPYTNIFHYSWQTYCELLGECSEKITELMLKDPPHGNGFHPYNYGGYLSWRVPQVKTFLDGRMAAWVQGSNERPPIELIGQATFAKQPIGYRLLDGTYHFSWAILPSYSPLLSFFDELVASGTWQKKYSDSLFFYYVKVL